MTIRYFADIRPLTAVNEEEWQQSESNLRTLLVDLGKKHPPFGPRVFEGDQLSSTIMIFVNGRNIEHLNGLETPLAPDDIVAVFPVVAGG